ncbi:hypothetical protein [Lacrimispora sp.]|uniref:hypothetical protein n=1 Tax=Lacrimispora sp. TaxID=2719234 RepID=UPI0028A1CE61|nr:hypothetical protein [Lacrimispora sp.]
MHIIRAFIEESTRYLGNIQEMNLFEKIFPAIAQFSVREKKGQDEAVIMMTYCGKEK